MLPEDEKQFLHKKLENFVVLIFKIDVDFNIDEKEAVLGFLMKVSTLRAKKEPFEITVPVFINLGKLKRVQV